MKKANASKSKSAAKSPAKAAVKSSTKPLKAAAKNAVKAGKTAKAASKPGKAIGKVEKVVKAAVKPAAKLVKAPAKSLVKSLVKAPAKPAAPVKAAASLKTLKSAKVPAKAPVPEKPAKVADPVKEAKAPKEPKPPKAAKAYVPPKEIKIETRSVPEEPDTAEDVVLTDADGNRFCRTKDCDRLSEVDNYCRYHYILLWKNIQIRRNILQEGKLGRYVEELTARYPDKFLEILKKDLRSEKDFLAAIQELEIDESAVEAEFDDEEAQSDIFEIQRVSDTGSGGDRSDSDDRF